MLSSCIILIVYSQYMGRLVCKMLKKINEYSITILKMFEKFLREHMYIVWTSCVY